MGMVAARGANCFGVPLTTRGHCEASRDEISAVVMNEKESGASLVAGADLLPRSAAGRA